MSTAADIGHGTLFKRWSGAAFVKVDGLIAPALPPLDRDMVDATDTESPNRYREFIPGLRTGGELQLEFEERLGNASQALLYTDFASDDPVQYQVVCNDDAETTWEFYGYVKSIGPGTPLDGKKTLAISIQITGEPTSE